MSPPSGSYPANGWPIQWKGSSWPRIAPHSQASVAITKCRSVLGETPLAVDGDVLEPSGGRHDLGPRLLDRDPSCAEAVGSGRGLELAAGEAAVELGLYERDHVNTVDPQGSLVKVGVVDLHRGDIRSANDSARQEAAGEPGAGEILVDELHVEIVARLSDASHDNKVHLHGPGSTPKDAAGVRWNPSERLPRHPACKPGRTGSVRMLTNQNGRSEQVCRHRWAPSDGPGCAIDVR